MQIFKKKTVVPSTVWPDGNGLTVRIQNDNITLLDDIIAPGGITTIYGAAVANSNSIEEGFVTAVGFAIPVIGAALINYYQPQDRNGVMGPLDNDALQSVKKKSLAAGLALGFFLAAINADAKEQNLQEHNKQQVSHPVIMTRE